MSDTRYVLSADVTAYALRRFGAVPTEWSSLSVNEQDRLVQEASEDLDLMFGSRWKGVRATRDQHRDHPRLGMVDRDGYSLPSATTAQGVKDAASELTLLKAKGEFTGLPTNRNRARIKSKAIGAKGLSKSVTYVGGKAEDATADRTYPVLEALLRDVLRDSGGTVQHFAGLG